jgi:hypothetical protein
MVTQQIRVVQWTTGNVGARSVRAVLAHPDLELVGCYAWSPDKVGRDVGELCDLDPIGVQATDDVGALLALNPDCVVYNPKWPDVAELVRILEAGVDVVTTAGFVTGLDLGRDEIAAACAAGGSSIFGAGMHPGYTQLVSLASTTICDRVDAVRVTESVDSSVYDSPDTERSVGFGRHIEDPALHGLVEEGTSVFRDAVELLAMGLGIELDEIRCVTEFARTTAVVDLGSWSIDPDCVAGVAGSWQGMRGGRSVVEANFRWRKGRTLEPDWKVENAWIVEVDGRPCVRTKTQIFPGTDHQVKGFKAYEELAMVVTAMPPIHVIPQVVAATPGILTYLDLPTPAASGFVTGG